MYKLRNEQKNNGVNLFETVNYVLCHSANVLISFMVRCLMNINKSLFNPPFFLLLEPLLCFEESSSLDCLLVLCYWLTLLLIFLRYPDIAHRLLISSLLLKICTDYARIVNLISYSSFMLVVNVFLFFLFFSNIFSP